MKTVLEKLRLPALIAWRVLKWLGKTFVFGLIEHAVPGGLALYALVMLVIDVVLRRG